MCINVAVLGIVTWLAEMALCGVVQGVLLQSVTAIGMHLVEEFMQPANLFVIQPQPDTGVLSVPAVDIRDGLSTFSIKSCILDLVFWSIFSRQRGHAKRTCLLVRCDAYDIIKQLLLCSN
jgi:hypothetical protein